MNEGIDIEIDVLCAQAYTRSERNGFWKQFPDRFQDERAWIGEKIALAHTELSEAIDASRKTGDDAARYTFILKELGDTIWRCLDMAYVIHQFNNLPVEVTLGKLMKEQAENMPNRGVLHGKRW